MIKVKLNHHGLSEFDFYTSEHAEWCNSINEMKKWCRATFGKGYDKTTRTWNWRSGSGYEEGTDEDNWEINYYYPVFYFASEEHASWFLMRWS